jgi:hypothetical protein
MAGAVYKLDSKNSLALKIYNNYEKSKMRT